VLPAHPPLPSPPTTHTHPHTLSLSTQPLAPPWTALDGDALAAAEALAADSLDEGDSIVVDAIDADDADANAAVDVDVDVDADGEGVPLAPPSLWFKRAPANLTQAVAAVAAAKKNGTLLSKLGRARAAAREAAGTAVAPPGVPATVASIVANNVITPSPSTPYIWGVSTSVTIGGSGFSSVPAENVVTFNRGAAGTVTAATPTSLTVSVTTQPGDLGTLLANVTTYGYTTATMGAVATVVPTVAASAGQLSQMAPSITVGGAGFSSNASAMAVREREREREEWALGVVVCVRVAWRSAAGPPCVCF